MSKSSPIHQVDRDSICPVTGKGHIPVTREWVHNGQPVKVHNMCKNCDGHIK